MNQACGEVTNLDRKLGPWAMAWRDMRIAAMASEGEGPASLPEVLEAQASKVDKMAYVVPGYITVSSASLMTTIPEEGALLLGDGFMHPFWHVDGERSMDGCS